MTDGGTVTVKVRPEIDLDALDALEDAILDKLADKLVERVIERVLDRLDTRGIRLLAPDESKEADW